MNTDEMGKEIGTESNTANKSGYYAEGIIKELWIADNKANTPDKGTAIETEVRFTLTPDKEYAIEAECNGEKKTCVVFWPSDFTKDIFADKENVNKGIALYAGDFTFFAPQGMTFDQLLLIKINACHVRICVESKDSLLDSETPDGKMNMKSLVQASEIRLKQK